MVYSEASKESGRLRKGTMMALTRVMTLGNGEIKMGIIVVCTS
jgi:hypothetical protein